MPNDWLMSALAAHDAYRGDEPAWPQAPEQYGPPTQWQMGQLAAQRGTIDPGTARGQMGSLAAMGRAGDVAGPVLGGIAHGVVDELKTPGAMFAKNPYDRGTEEWQSFEDSKYKMAAPWARGMALNTMGTGAVAGVPMRAGEAVLGSGAVRPIRAYHSSPHDFEKFDASKIGTGEGAQVYGHGLYFAENPKVSGIGGEYYKAFEGQFLKDNAEGRALDYLRHSGYDRQQAIKFLDETLAERAARKLTGEPTHQKLVEARELLASGGKVGPRTYEVDIHARPEQFLDWDKPLKAQGSHIDQSVYDTLMRSGIDKDYANYVMNNKTGQDAVRSISRPSFSVRNDAASPWQATGTTSYEEALKMAGGDTKRLLRGMTPDPIYTSQAFRESGIPGIRYLDQGSRNLAQATPEQIASLRMSIASKEEAHRNTPWLIDTEKNTWGARNLAALEEEKRKLAAALNPTSNYVVFPGNEHLLRIAKKYGLAGAVPTMGALAAQDRYAEQ